MAMTKSMEMLIERAERKGEAVKRVREGAVMGNEIPFMNPGEYSKWVKTTPMIEQWKVEYKRELNQDGSVSKEWKVYHYDTLIFHADNNCAGGWVLAYYYGESNTDRDTINSLCNYFDINARFSYSKKNGFRPMHG